MLALRLPLRVAARVAPLQTRLASPIAASIASYRSKSDAASKPTKADATSKPKKAAAAPKPGKSKVAAKPTKPKAAAKPKEVDPVAKKAARKAAKAAAAKKAFKLLSPEEQAAASAKAKVAKAKEEVKLLKAQALSPPGYRKVNAWAMYVKENTKAKSQIATANMKALAQDFKSLSTREKEHLNHLITENNTNSVREFQEWLSKHSPAQILEANAARAQLRQKLAATNQKYLPIKDDRLVKRPTGAYLIYHNERFGSGDFRNIPVVDAARDIGAEYRALSAGEKKKFEDAAAKDHERYVKEYRQLYGVEPPSIVAKERAAQLAAKKSST